MDDDRFISVPTASVLCGIGINGQLMHLAKKQRIAKLFADDLREYIPALWRSVIATVVKCIFTARHFNPQPGQTDSLALILSRSRNGRASRITQNSSLAATLQSVGAKSALKYLAAYIPSPGSAIQDSGKSD